MRNDLPQPRDLDVLESGRPAQRDALLFLPSEHDGPAEILDRRHTRLRRIRSRVVHHEFRSAGRNVHGPGIDLLRLPTGLRRLQGVYRDPLPSGQRVRRLLRALADPRARADLDGRHGESPRPVRRAGRRAPRRSASRAPPARRARPRLRAPVRRRRRAERRRRRRSKPRRTLPRRPTGSSRPRRSRSLRRSSTRSTSSFSNWSS